MLKGIIGSLLVLALVFGLTSLVLAEDTAQNPSAESQKYQPILQRLQAQIKELEMMIARLKEKLSSLKEERDFSKKEDISREDLSVLKPGAKDKEKLGGVFKLQVMLKETGHLSAIPTGYYGDLTRKAVEKFQIEKGLLREFKSGSATDKEKYLKSLTDNSVIPPGTTVKFGDCFTVTATDVASLAHQRQVDDCVKAALGYGKVNDQAIAALDKAVEVKAEVEKFSDLRQETPITGPSGGPKGQGGGGGKAVPVKECKGDTNRNGIVNNFDIDSYREFYEKNKNSTITVYDPLFWFADINDNNVLDQIDIDLFTEILVGTRVPECRNVTN